MLSKKIKTALFIVAGLTCVFFLNSFVLANTDLSIKENDITFSKEQTILAQAAPAAAAIPLLLALQNKLSTWVPLNIGSLIWGSKLTVRKTDNSV